MDKQLLGFWRVRSLDMIEDRAVRLIAGLPDQVVEFTAPGNYVVWADPRRPARYRCRSFMRKGIRALDVWIEGLEPLRTHCIYHVDGSHLQIGIAGDSGSRPTELRRDDERLWCVLSCERCEPPPRARPARPRKLLQPGRLIPRGMFGKPRTGRGR
jgi:hypothetical protein